MAKTSFYFKDKSNKKEEQIIYLLFTYESTRLRISTKQKCSIENFDLKKQRVKDSIKIQNSNQINKELNIIESTIVEVYNQFLKDYDRVPNPKELKSFFQSVYFDGQPTSKKVNRSSVIEYFDDYIDTIKANTTKSTIDKYKQAKINFEEFQILNKRIYNVDMLDLEFRNKYVDFLVEHKNYKPSTIYRKLKFLRTVLYFVEEQGVQIHSFVKSNRFLTKDVEVDNLALSEIELKEIESLDLSENTKLDKVRDLFLIGCYTGQRFSDYNKIKLENIVDEKYIAIRQQKTQEPILIPITNDVERILSKYNYRLPSISNVKFNSYLKEVGAKCESLQTIIGSKSNGDNLYKYELLKSHTARRTYVTINYSRGIDLNTLSIGTGHKQIKSISSYVKMNDKQKADLLRSKLEGNGNIL